MNRWDTRRGQMDGNAQTSERRSAMESVGYMDIVWEVVGVKVGWGAGGKVGGGGREQVGVGTVYICKGRPAY